MVPKSLEDDFCSVLYGMARSKRHHTYTLRDIERLVVPPLVLGQYVIDSEVFVSWAFFDEETEYAFENRIRKLEPEDWNGGNSLWIIDVVVWGLGRSRLLSVRHRIKERYPGRTAKFRRWYPDKPRKLIKMEVPDVVPEGS